MRLCLQRVTNTKYSNFFSSKELAIANALTNVANTKWSHLKKEEKRDVDEKVFSFPGNNVGPHS